MRGIGPAVERGLNIFERLIVVATGMTLVVSMLYVAGNYQDFSEATQEFLLLAARSLGAAAFVAIIPAALVEAVVIIVRRRWNRVFRAAVLVLAGIVTGSVLLGSAAILVLQKPL